MAKRRGRRSTPARARISEHEVYERIAARATSRSAGATSGFAFPATVAFMVWYITYVVCNIWARDFMNTPVVGNINIALVFGLLQFVSTFLIAFLYSRYSTKNLDPLADKLRASSSETRPIEDRPDHRPVPRRRRPDPGHHLLGLRQSKTPAQYYAGGRSVQRVPERPGHQRRLHVGRLLPRHLRAIALFGYDGFLYSIGFLVAWLVALLLVAELLRNSGRYTMADLLAYRMRQTPRYGRGHLHHRGVDLLPAGPDGGRGQPGRPAARVTSEGLKAVTIVGVGVLMIIYVTLGGMKGTTWVQIVKAVLLMAAAC